MLEEHDELLACDVVLVEGGPVRSREVDTVVFVASPLADGESLLVEERREVARIDGVSALALLLGLDPNTVSDVPDEIDGEDVRTTRSRRRTPRARRSKRYGPTVGGRSEPSLAGGVPARVAATWAT